jgi:hypothetical protein
MAKKNPAMDCGHMRYFGVLRPEKADLERLLRIKISKGNVFFLTMLFGKVSLFWKFVCRWRFDSYTFSVY